MAQAFGIGARRGRPTQPEDLREPASKRGDVRRDHLKGVRTEMAKLNIKPLGDKVIVKRVEAEEKTAGGIVLPDSAKEKPKRGVVLAVGTGRLLDDGTRGEMQVKVSDEVLFTSYAGTEIKAGGQELMIMDEADILGIIG